jgi:hypothetical protein
MLVHAPADCTENFLRISVRVSVDQVLYLVCLVLLLLFSPLGVCGMLLSDVVRH